MTAKEKEGHVEGEVVEKKQLTSIFKIDKKYIYIYNKKKYSSYFNNGGKGGGINHISQRKKSHFTIHVH